MSDYLSVIKFNKTQNVGEIMALTKETIIEIGKIAEPYKNIHIRQTTRIFEDGKMISESHHRHVCNPDHRDITDQDQKVQDIANLVWTDVVKQAWSDLKKSQE